MEGTILKRESTLISLISFSALFSFSFSFFHPSVLDAPMPGVELLPLAQSFVCNSSVCNGTDTLIEMQVQATALTDETREFVTWMRSRCSSLAKNFTVNATEVNARPWMGGCMD